MKFRITIDSSEKKQVELILNDPKFNTEVNAWECYVNWSSKEFQDFPAFGVTSFQAIENAMNGSRGILTNCYRSSRIYQNGRPFIVEGADRNY